MAANRCFHLNPPSALEKKNGQGWQRWQQASLKLIFRPTAYSLCNIWWCWLVRSSDQRHLHFVNADGANHDGRLLHKLQQDCCQLLPEDMHHHIQHASLHRRRCRTTVLISPKRTTSCQTQQIRNSMDYHIPRVMLKDNLKKNVPQTKIPESTPVGTAVD